MSKKYDFEYIVIGSGPAGSAAALSLVAAKKNVALIEGRFFGGSNINTRDIPYDVALNFANLYHAAITAPEFKNQDFSFNFSSIVSHQLASVLTCSKENKKLYESRNLICIEGFANFLDAHTVAVGTRKFTARNFILATGAHLKVSEIAGTDTTRYYTPESAIQIRRKPQAVFIVGGGSTGCEIATYFAELGTKVLIAETAERLLPHEDKEVSEAIANHLSKDLGVMVLPSCKVVALEQDDISQRVIFRNARTEKMVRVDCIVLATGSEPNLNYGLENAGVKYKNTGILTDKFFTTSAKHIYAIGDARGKDSSTEIADYEGSVLVSNLIHHNKNPINYRGFTRITKTNPEVAVVGLNEYDLARRDRKCRKSLIKLSDLPVGAVENLSNCFVKLITDRSYHIIGASIVAPHAHLLTEEISLAIRHNLTTLEIASTPHNINSYSYAIKLAAKKLLTKKSK